MRVLLVAAGLLTGANVWADTAISDLTATNTESTYIHGALADYSYWTLEGTGGGMNSGSSAYIAWFYNKNTTNTLSTVSDTELPTGTYLLSSNLLKWDNKRSTNTLAITNEDGTAEIATNDINVLGINYTAFYVSEPTKVQITFTVAYGGSNGTTQIAEQVLYTVTEGTTVGDYTALFAEATAAEIESMLAGMSEAQMALGELIATANANYTSTESMVGDGVFQMSAALRDALKAAIDAAQAVYDDAAATDSDYEAQTAALTAANDAFMTTYNAPDAEKYYYLTISDGAFYINMNGYDAWNNGDLMPVLSEVPYAVQFEAKDAAANEYYIKNAAGQYYVKGASNYATNVSDEASTYFIVYPQSDGTIQLKTSWSNYYLALTAANRKLGSGVGATNKDYLNITVTEADAVTVAATVEAGLLTTFVAPFDVELPAEVKAYSCTYANGELSIAKTASQTIAANTPVLLYSETTYSNEFEGYAQSFWSGLPESGSLVGTLTDTVLPTDGTAYVLQAKDGETGFAKVTDEETLAPANTAYLKVAEAADDLLFIVVDERVVTGISAMLKAEAGMAADKAVYNLSGQRIANAPSRKGLYIVEGKKLVVK